MKPSNKKLEGSSLWWDNAHIQEPAPSRCITGTDHEFEVVANYLLSSVAIQWPDDTKLELNPNIANFNTFLRNAAHRIAIQMLSTIEYCNEIIGGGMKLRQKPDNPCVMQQEQIEGVWTDVFDYSLCLTDGLNQAFEEQNSLDTVKNLVPITQAFWDDFQDRYTGTSASYDPALTIEPENELTSRAALCAALKGQIDNYVAQSVQAKNQFVDELSRGGVAIAVTMSILAILALLVSWGTAAPLLPGWFALAFSAGNAAIMQVSLGMATAAIAVWVQKVKDVDSSVLEDTGAAEDILCVWYENLQGESDISMEKYQEELDMSSSSSNAQALYAVIKPLIDQGLSYAAFLNSWKVQMSYSEAGIILDLCACEDYPIEFVNHSSSYPATVIEFKGINGSNQAIWDFTLESTGLNASDAIVVRSTNTAHTFLNVFIKNTQVISGSFSALESNGVNREDTPIHYDPTYEHWHWVMYASSFPATIRLTAEIGTN